MLRSFFVFVTLSLSFTASLVLANETDQKLMFDCDQEQLFQTIKKHDIVGCQKKQNGKLNLLEFDSSKTPQNIKKQGLLVSKQLKFNGDWVVTPNIAQIVLNYKDELTKYDAKLIYDDIRSANFVFYHDYKSYWMTVSVIGDGIHQIKIIRQDGLFLPAEFRLGHIKSRIKRYGKIDFYKLRKNEMGEYLPRFNKNIELIVEYLKQNQDLRFYLVKHQDSEQKDEIDIKQSQMDADKLLSVLIDLGVDPNQVEAKGNGPLDPHRAHAKINSTKKNNRFTLVIRR